MYARLFYHNKNNYAILKVCFFIIIKGVIFSPLISTISFNRF